MVLSEFLQRIKSALGVDGSRGRQQSPGQQQQPAQEASESSEQHVGVTVEREPATASEDAVKGTETASESEPTADAVEDEPESEAAEAASATDDEASEAEPETDDEEVMADEEADEEHEASEDDATVAEDDLGTDESVDVVKGIGPTYAEHLGEAGVDTVADLAHADAAELAAETDISETRLSNWIEKAKHR